MKLEEKRKCEARERENREEILQAMGKLEADLKKSLEANESRIDNCEIEILELSFYPFHNKLSLRMCKAFSFFFIIHTFLTTMVP